jgi:hypothetical protein
MASHLQTTAATEDIYPSLPDSGGAERSIFFKPDVEAILLEVDNAVYDHSRADARIPSPPDNARFDFATGWVLLFKFRLQNVRQVLCSGNPSRVHPDDSGDSHETLDRKNCGKAMHHDCIRLIGSYANFVLDYRSFPLDLNADSVRIYSGGLDATTPRSAMLSPLLSEGTAFT